jgi:hypothetical protein
MNFYAQHSTSNPTGWRPWNSRLSYYVPNAFPVPTTGRGPFMLNPGVQLHKTQAGGLSYYLQNNFPLPTTGRGEFLLQNGSAGSPAQAGGLAAFDPRARYLTGMGQSLVDDVTSIFSNIDPTLMFAGLGLLAVVYLMTGKKRKTRRKKRLRSSIAKKQAQLMAI